MIPIPAMNIKTAAIAILALVFVTMAWQLKVQLKRVGELEIKLATQAQETQEAADANGTNMETIATLEAALADLEATRAREAAEREAVLVRRSQELSRALAEADRLRDLREEEQDENESCADLVALDLGVFCPTTADQLRQRSRGPGSNGDAND